jgi:hypothetical protein
MGVWHKPKPSILSTRISRYLVRVVVHGRPKVGVVWNFRAHYIHLHLGPAVFSHKLGNYAPHTAESSVTLHNLTLPNWHCILYKIVWRPGNQVSIILLCTNSKGQCSSYHRKRMQFTPQLSAHAVQNYYTLS